MSNPCSSADRVLEERIAASASTLKRFVDEARATRQASSGIALLGSALLASAYLDCARQLRELKEMVGRADAGASVSYELRLPEPALTVIAQLVSMLGSAFSVTPGRKDLESLLESYIIPAQVRVPTSGCASIIGCQLVELACRMVDASSNVLSLSGVAVASKGHDHKDEPKAVRHPEVDCSGDFCTVADLLED